MMNEQSGTPTETDSEKPPLETGLNSETAAFLIDPMDVQTKVKEPSPHDGSMRTLSFRYARTRDPEARKTLILYHQKLVHYVATRFVGGGESLEDLIQVGNIGLINALDRFDPSKEVKFSTYAMPTIVGEIKRHFRDKTWQVKVPRWLQELSINVRKCQETLSVRLGRTPTVKELAAALETTEDRVLEAFEIGHISNTISLDSRLDASAGSDSATLIDLIGHSDRGLNDIDSYSDLRRALENLDSRERQVIELRFFDEMSQSKIATEMNISQMHVSRLQTRALQRLRDILAEEGTRLRRTVPGPRAPRKTSLPN